MNKEMRATKLKEIQDKHEPYMQGIRINYKGSIRQFPAYQIPLSYLIYNKYNGRIGSAVKSYERQYGDLNPEDPDDAAKIEDFLWDSKISRNKYTRENIVENGQKVQGIVTADGIIIDGNRRAMLLNKIWSKRKDYEKNNHNVDSCQFFVAVILPEDADKQEILKLETTYQMGEDEKLDYNAIEKYLRCKELHLEGVPPTDIAHWMGESESDVNEMLAIMELMNEYLLNLGYSGMYTRLDKTEGQFVDLVKYLRKYERGSKMVKWEYDPELDVNELKLVCFDYIRGRYEGKEFRLIANSSKKESIFCKDKNLWDSFLGEHKEKVRLVKEKSVEELRKDTPDEDMSKLLAARDADWEKAVAGSLKGNLKKHERKLEDLNEANQPIELAMRALSTLQAINQEIEEFYTGEVHEVLHEINRLSDKMMRSIKKIR